MANFTDRFSAPVNLITGGLIGSNLLANLKNDMIQQAVFQAMFGAVGERIFFQEMPAYNETIFPLIEAYWASESYQSQDTYLTGSFNGRIILPTKLETKSDINIQRSIAAAFARFLNSDKNTAFTNFLGLIEFGTNLSFTYDRLFQFQGLTAPCIDFTLPFKFDLHWFGRNNPDVDLRDNLDAALIGWIESYRIKVFSDNNETLIPEGTLYETGETN